MLKPTVFVCRACGKVGETRRTIGDESCYLHAVECWRSSVVLRSDKDRRATAATTTDTAWVEPPPPPPRKDPPTDVQLAARGRRIERRAARRTGA